ncbi:MAG: aldolase [Nitrospirae bacterium CG_4_10_14_3_um_filter_44_29]|nr:aldolase [Nitrospirota bacterium]OIO28938.1 MAG: aldolase [Nitrospirae bacterium CG1_02_44_142]PIP70777.1 MAG: aldolase [Nitrospirae bacterium CG22_combo_CG10-13_8_21_14_all_44_11]PIV41398.1 MAG: aldolase [Nitrospirae bacterium CG02_land_8_20_14_3_00_44_33]PIV66002.1 MAG: aldolase [Nitrospirae bacterium CG01_land_8_20_14_3_00_44_22]PIW90576.1 MAG: aldolase [Nitrospirae bacterium CG_4_8_14_3_um_filter_44_28]PIX87905.1 MAG: aldolase [Nitrospirae bacterium CG_4_10_14_3_um_filter_44_29]PJA826
MDLKGLKGILSVNKGILELKDKAGLQKIMDELIYEAVFTEDKDRQLALFLLIKEAAKAAGAVPASIQGLYEEMGRSYPGFTVPAINIRGLTYDAAKAIFRKANQVHAGALIFEIARSEIGYTKQRPLEYSTVVLAAAVKEGFSGPVFVQGDHFQLVRKNYLADPKPETDYAKGLIKEAVEAEFYNIDIDSSTLVDLEKPSTKEQQRPNFEKTAELGAHIREIQPKGINVSIGGEIGEIGGKNSSPDELRTYLDGFKETFKAGKGLSKLSVQTGTTHGGVVLPDGTLAKVKIDFDTLRTLSDMARKEYGLSGCVQHGASTLPEEAFHMFPETGTSEVHLATGFQNIMYDCKSLPSEFRNEVYQFIKTEYAKERKEGQTEEQFIYSTRKKGFGPLKKKWWNLPSNIKALIMKELEDKFGLLFDKLKVGNTQDIVKRTVRPVNVKKEIPELLKKEL